MSLVKQGLFLALGLFAFAVLATAIPGKSADAQEARIAIGFEVTKVCVGGAEGPFEVEVELAIGNLVLAEGDFDIDCRETVVVCIAEGRGDDDDDDNGPPGGGDDDDDDDDTDLVQVEAIVDIEDCDVFLDFVANGPVANQLAVIRVVEVDVSDDIRVTYGGDCSVNGVIEIEDELDILAEIECVITNTSLPDVSVAKVCPAGTGAGSFSVSVDGQSKPILCGATVTFDDVEGDVTISEIISGASTYNTIIACAVNGQLVVSQPGLSVTLQDLDFGDEVRCAIFNTLVVVGGVTPPAPTLPQIINIINKIEVINVVENNNNNTNVNNNENTNTQNQSNQQSVNVTSTGGTANVHVDADDDKKHHSATQAVAAKPAATGAISPPRAGDAGLVSSDSGSNSALLAIAGVVVAVAGLGTAARIVRR